MGFFRAIVISMRPVLLALVVGLMLAGVVLGTGWRTPALLTLQICVSATLIVGAQFLVNDVMDIEIDRQKAKPPPIASGAVSVAAALWVAGLLTLAGLALAMLVAPLFALWWLLIAVLLTVYSTWITFHNAALANVMVAVCVTLALLSPLAVFSNVWAVVAVSPMTFLSILAREIALDLEDASVDRGVRKRQLYVLVGPSMALAIALGLFVSQVAASYVPVVLGTVRIWYVIGISIINGIAAVAVYREGRDPTRFQEVTRTVMFSYIAVALTSAW